ncbi:MAG: M64 family metallopeptidase, partial [Acidimicrobiia bacterium]|nr:M64 family metallopeptidase [Acidimicrobiia bacterium]
MYYDFQAPDGSLTGGWIELPMPDPGEITAPSDGVTVTTIVDNGDPMNRLDLVYVGDGYQAHELDLYATHVLGGMNGLFDEEPFRTYQTLFNVHRVDVISNESGVDHDPTFGIMRDTALDMGFFCSGIARLLCVNVGDALSYAASAPDVDQVFAVANSTTYGGAGYSGSDLATFSGGNGLARDVAIHELGHSLGNLADEYDYNDGATYTGSEPSASNVSTLTSDAMATAKAKWHRWLGESDPGFDGLVSTYEGAMYHEFGLYRPTGNSMMRSLNRPFNLPSAEALITEIYRVVDPIDDATDAGVTLLGEETVFVQPVTPVDHTLDVQWFIDGDPIADATGHEIDLATVPLTDGTHTLKVVVVDNTPLVRDPAVRAMLMTSTRSWTVTVASGTLGDLDGDGSVG